MNITDSIKKELDGKYRKAIEDNLEIQFYYNFTNYYFVDSRFYETCEHQVSSSEFKLLESFKSHIDKDPKNTNTIVDVDGFFYKIHHSTLTKESNIIEMAKNKAYKMMKVRIISK